MKIEFSRKVCAGQTDIVTPCAPDGAGHLFDFGSHKYVNKK